MKCEYIIHTMIDILSMTDEEIKEYQKSLLINRKLIDRELTYTEIILEDRRTADEIIHSEKDN